MRISYVVIFSVGSVFITSNCQAALASPELEEKLNICRHEYKQLVATTNEELKKLKAKGPANFPAFYKEKEQALQEKADSCKQIKRQVAETKKFEQANLAVVAPMQAGSKFGPKFRCLQLGQNWTEFQTCARSLGYAPRLSKTTKGTLAFTVADRTIWANVDSNYYINRLMIDGGDFWGAKIFDQHFLNAFVENYEISELVHDLLAIEVTTAFKIPPIPYYKGNIQHGTVVIFPDKQRVIIEKATKDSGYKF